MSDHIRLLACQQCLTIEIVPDYDGPPERDFLLVKLLERHKTNDLEHIGALFKVEEKHWSDERKRKEIKRQIEDKMLGGETGLGHVFYDLKDTFQEDAMACWKAHQRNPACSDYKSDSKRLTPGTAAERREAGLPEYRTANDRYLCEFCPVHSLVEAAMRTKAGLDQ